jgi:hypothetical protein
MLFSTRCWAACRKRALVRLLFRIPIFMTASLPRTYTCGTALWISPSLVSLSLFVDPRFNSDFGSCSESRSRPHWLPHFHGTYTCGTAAFHRYRTVSAASVSLFKWSINDFNFFFRSDPVLMRLTSTGLIPVERRRSTGIETSQPVGQA